MPLLEHLITGTYISLCSINTLLHHFSFFIFFLLGGGVCLSVCPSHLDYLHGTLPTEPCLQPSPILLIFNFIPMSSIKLHKIKLVVFTNVILVEIMIMGDNWFGNKMAMVHSMVKLHNLIDNFIC